LGIRILGLGFKSLKVLVPGIWDLDFGIWILKDETLPSSSEKIIPLPLFN
jgi:hypothetical protein